ISPSCPGRHERSSSSCSPTPSRTCSQPRSTASAPRAGADPRLPSGRPLCDAETRDELCASVGLRVDGPPAAEELVLALLTQHERDSLADVAALALERQLVGARPITGHPNRSRRREGRGELAPELVGCTIELRHDPRPELGR